MSKVKLLVQSGYKNAYYGVQIVEVEKSQLPFDVAPSMHCHNLERIPKKGEVILLGYSDTHYFPSDVEVKLASNEAVDYIKALQLVDYDDNEEYWEDTQTAWNLVDIPRETILTFHQSDEPFLIKRGKDFVFFYNPGYTSLYYGQVYKGSINVLNEVISRVKPVDFMEMINNKRIAQTMTDHWQESVNYAYSGKGGTPNLSNPEEGWNDELCRRGLLKCPQCMQPMEMYYGPQCFRCSKPKADSNGLILLVPAIKYVELKYNVNINDFVFKHVTGNDKIVDIPENKQTKLLHKEFPSATFFASW